MVIYLILNTYDNNGKKDAREALKASVAPFVELGIVEVIPWEGRKQQPAVDDCAARVAKYQLFYLI